MEFWILILTLWAFYRWVQSRIRRQNDDERFANVIEVLNRLEPRLSDLKNWKPASTSSSSVWPLPPRHQHSRNLQPLPPHQLLRPLANPSDFHLLLPFLRLSKFSSPRRPPRIQSSLLLLIRLFHKHRHHRSLPSKDPPLLRLLRCHLRALLPLRSPRRQSPRPFLHAN